MDFSFGILDASEESGLSDGIEVSLPSFSIFTPKQACSFCTRKVSFTETESCFELSNCRGVKYSLNF